MNAQQIAQGLGTAASRQEARDLLASLTKAQLLEVAEAAGCLVYRAENKASTARRIVEGTAGSRLDVAAIRGGNW